MASTQQDMAPLIPLRAASTARLNLEPLSPEHSDELWTGVQTSIAELRKWFPWAVSATAASTESLARSGPDNWRSNLEWKVVIRFQDTIIGSVGLIGYSPFLNSASLTYWIRSDLSGRGFATEASKKIIDLGFSHAKLHRLHLLAATENPASQRVAEKLGFAREGVMKGAGKGNQGYHDLAVYGLIHDDWARRVDL